MPSLDATPSARIASANDPWAARPRMSASLSSGTRPVAASRSWTSSATALTWNGADRGSLPGALVSSADESAVRRSGGRSKSISLERVIGIPTGNAERISGELGYDFASLVGLREELEVPVHERVAGKERHNPAQ